MRYKLFPAGLLFAALALMPLKADPSALFTLPAEARQAKSAYAALKAASLGYQGRLAADRKALATAEAASLVAWAVARAQPLEGAAPDGSYAGAQSAATAFAKGRDRALAAARDIENRRAEKSPGSAASALAELKKRAAILSRLFLGGSLSQSAASYAAAETELLALSPDLKHLFPEAIEAGKLLKASGRTGRRLWLASLAAGDAEEVASSLLSSRKAIAAALPAAASRLDRLEAALGAHEALSRVSLLFLYPGAEGPERGSFAPALKLFLGLGSERSLELLKAEDGSAYRLLEERQASGRLASVLSRLPESRLRGLALDLGLSAGELASLSSLAALASDFSAPAQNQPFGSPASRARTGKKLEEEALALNTLLVASAAEGQGRRSVYLGLLERPELLALAASESRYSKLYADAHSALSSFFAQADAEAEKEIARLPSVSRAAASLFPKSGEAPRVEIAAFELADLPGSRAIAFAAKVSGPEGKAFLLPIEPSLAGPIYARAFARAVNGAASSGGETTPEALLSRCRVFVHEALPRAEEVALLPSSPYPAAKAPGGEADLDRAAGELEAEIISGAKL
jgi:hypothetical protein